MASQLIDRQLKTARPGTELADATVKGLRFRVSDKGLKTFFYRYRPPGSKALKRVSLGHYGTKQGQMTLQQARTACLHLSALRKDGIDPQEHKRQERLAAEAKMAIESADAYTMGVLCQEFQSTKQTVPSKRTKRLIVPRTLQQYRQIISADIEPRWKDRPVRSITKRELVDARDAIAKRGAIQANRFVTLIRMLFKYAAERERIEGNVAATLEGAVTEGERERFLEDDELQKLIRWIPKSSLDDSIRTALLLVLYTGARNEEVAKVHSREFQDGIWTIPPERNKSHRAFRICLSRQAAELAKSRIAKVGDGYLFAKRGSDNPLDSDGFANRIRRARKELKIPSWTLHDLRRSMSTWLQEQGVSREVADERMLNHKPQGIARKYDRAKRDKLAAEAWQLWGDHLEALARSNVVAMKGRSA